MKPLAITTNTDFEELGILDFRPARMPVLHRKSPFHWFLLTWAIRFNAVFRLRLPGVIVRVGSLSDRDTESARVHGVHRRDGDRSLITLSDAHVRDDQPWKVISTLAHELVHAWQDTHGRPDPDNDHDAEFRRMMLRFGIRTSEDGFDEFVPGGAFTRLLLANGVWIPPYLESGE